MSTMVYATSCTQEAAVTQVDSREALSRAFGRCCDGLYRFITIRVNGDTAVADDCMQQTCLEAGKSSRIPPEDEIEPWLFGIAKNIIRKHFRSRRREKIHQIQLDETTQKELIEAIDTRPLPQELLCRREAKQQLRLAITALAQQDQDIIEMCYFLGRSQDDIAKKLGISVRGVEGRLYRARANLRQQLAHLDLQEGAL